MRIRLAAVPMVLDATYGVVLEDLLDAAELDLLLGPWEEVVGSPFDNGPNDRDLDGPADAEADDEWPAGEIPERDEA
mgnify:CR=1 FL=1